MQNADFEHVTVHTRPMNISLQELKNSVDANDIITDPDYQRKYVYDDKRASCLIESILIGIPIPVIYLAEEDEGVYSVIDGQQRITSFVRYLNSHEQNFKSIVVTMDSGHGRNRESLIYCRKRSPFLV